MEGIFLGIIFSGISIAMIVLGIQDCTKEGSNLKKYRIPLGFIVFAGALYVIPNMTYVNAEAKYVHNEMLGSMYKEELNDMENGFEETAKLNPNVTVLVNQDTPIATTNELRSDLIKRLTSAKKVAYEARILMSTIENGLFSYAVVELEEEAIQ